MSNMTTLDTFALINAFADDRDGAAQMIAAMDATERGEVIAKLLGLLTAIVEHPERSPVETLALFLGYARRG